MAKRLFIFCLLFLLFSSSYNVFAATWSYQWTNQIVEVPVGASLEGYKSLPKASLYKNGELMSDANITYLREGDWLYYMKDVDTSKVGEYKVWYKAFENGKYKPGTCNNYKCLVTFRVVDKIKPKIEIVNKELTLKKGDTYDFASNVIVTDNYSNDIYLYFDKTIDQIVGEEYVNVVAVDGSGNRATASFLVKMTNISKPIIIFKNLSNTLNIPKNGTLDISEFFTAYDAYDGDITDRIFYPTISLNELGVYDYTVSVTNSSNLQSSYTISINVIDDVSPIIELINDIEYFEYNTDISKINFKDYIIITDNEEIDYNKLSITYSIENVVGSYYVNYSYDDGTFIVQKKLKVVLISSNAPVIEVDDIEIYVNEDFDIFDYINIIDDSDPNIYSSIEVFENIDLSTPGEYPVTIYAVNSSGLSSSKELIVRVLDEDIIAEDEIIVNDNDEFDSVLYYLKKRDEEQQIRNNIIFISLIVVAVGVLVFQIVSYKKKKNI